MKERAVRAFAAEGGERFMTDGNWKQAGSVFKIGLAVLLFVILVGSMSVLPEQAQAAGKKIKKGSTSLEQKRKNARKAIISSAKKQKKKILSSKSEWTVGEGKHVYYVSENGNDTNDGRTPETAWATLDKVNSAACPEGFSEDSIKRFPEFLWAVQHPEEKAELESGDVVLFERGGSWRGVLRSVEGVTYSAYGTGDKPRISSSPENGTGKEKWKLVSGTTNIWEFYKTIQDCGGILLGEDTVAIKNAPFWSEEKQCFLNTENRENSSGEEYQKAEPFDYTMLDDLQFFNELDFDGSVQEDVGRLFSATGKLYLRCDAGNPGKVYSSIEFFTGNNAYNQGIASPADGVIFDNLAFYHSSVGVNAQQNRNVIVRNCDIRYGGGIVQAYNLGWDENGNVAYASIVRCGDGIGIGGTNNRAENNFVSNYFDNGITVEEFWYDGAESDNPRKNITISGNLIEYCNGGIMVADWMVWQRPEREDFVSFQDIRIENNTCMYSGLNGWSRQEAFETGYSISGALCIFLNRGASGIITVKGNTFFETPRIAQLVVLHYMKNGEKTPPVVFTDNTYVQKSSGRIAEVARFELTPENSYLSDIYEWIQQDKQVNKKVKKYLGDRSAVTVKQYKKVIKNHRK